MKIAFLMPDAPLSVNFKGGGAGRFLANFDALHALGHHIEVLRVAAPEVLSELEEGERDDPQHQASRAKATDWSDIAWSTPRRTPGRLKNGLKSLLDPVEYQFPGSAALSRHLSAQRVWAESDLIWVETTPLAAAVMLAGPRKPWIFSHTDWLHRVFQVRWGRSDWKTRWELAVCRRAEIRIARSAMATLAISCTDADRLKAVGCRRVCSIPSAHAVDVAFAADHGPADDFRLIHLGSPSTTSNRVGLEAYLARVHSAVQTACIEVGNPAQLWIVGDITGLKEPLAGRLNHAKAVFSGFVKDLSTVLRPYDVALIPYEHDTGFRTKLPVLFKHGQVVVTTRAAVLGSWVDGLDRACIVLDRLEEFPHAIRRLAANKEERIRLGRAARDFFERHFSYDAVQAQYRELLSSAFPGG